MHYSMCPNAFIWRGCGSRNGAPGNWGLRRDIVCRVSHTLCLHLHRTKFPLSCGVIFNRTVLHDGARWHEEEAASLTCIHCMWHLLPSHTDSRPRWARQTKLFHCWLLCISFGLWFHSELLYFLPCVKEMVQRQVQCDKPLRYKICMTLQFDNTSCSIVDNTKI